MTDHAFEISGIPGFIEPREHRTTLNQLAHPGREGDAMTTASSLPALYPYVLAGSRPTFDDWLSAIRGRVSHALPPTLERQAE